MDKVITRNLLRSFYSGIEPFLKVADDSEIEAVVNGIAFDDAPVVPVLAPGAYDENMNFLKSWDSLFENEDHRDGYGRKVVGNVLYGSDDAEKPWAALNGVSTVVVDPSIVSFGAGDEYGVYQFATCEDIKRVVLPDTLLDLGTYSTFYWCINLEEINIPNSLSEIPLQCFIGCTNLKRIHLPNSITKIGQGAFRNSGLLDITIPSSVVEIEYGVFGFCENLTTIHYSGTATGAPWDAPNAVVVP